MIQIDDERWVAPAAIVGAHRGMLLVVGSNLLYSGPLADLAELVHVVDDLWLRPDRVACVRRWGDQGCIVGLSGYGNIYLEFVPAETVLAALGIEA